MTARTWLIFVLLGQAALCARHLHRIPCTDHEYCMSEKTHLRCRPSPLTDLRECLCHHTEIFNGTQCWKKVGVVCEIHEGPKCVVGAECRRFEFDSDEGVCKCGSGYTDDEETAGLCMPAPKASFGAACKHEAFCKPEETFMKCLSIRVGAPQRCSCGFTHVFDEENGKCRVRVGGSCTVKSDANPSPQECVRGARCVPNVDVAGVFTDEGTCAEDRIVKNVMAESQTKEKLHNKTCSADSDCSRESTFLRCLLVRTKPHVKVCHCGNGNVYDEKAEQCFLGEHNVCEHPTYRNRKPQKCIPGAECRTSASSSAGLEKSSVCMCRLPDCSSSGVVHSSKRLLLILCTAISILFNQRAKLFK